MGLSKKTTHRAPVAGARSSGWALLALCAVALALGGCGSTHHGEDSTASPSESADVDGPPRSESSRAAVATPPRAVEADGSKRIAKTVGEAKTTYRRETKGWKLRGEADRLAHDGILLGALARGDVAGAQAEADAQLRSPANHLGHVTRISVTRGQKVLLNATLNSDGTFVVAPARRVLQLHGRHLGTLLVSIQDVTGFVKLVHRRTLADVVVRGASGQVRASLPPAARVQLPLAGNVRIAGRTYVVRSFRRVGWGNEALTVWILESAHSL